MTSRPKALFACHNIWTSTFRVGSHHLARELVKTGWDVAFISDPISPFHMLSKPDGSLRQRYSLYRSGGTHDLEGHLWAYVPGALLTPNRYPLMRTNWVCRSWYRLTTPDLLRTVQSKGFAQVDLLYFDSVYQSFWLDQIEYRKSVFRIADNIKGYDRFTPAIGAAEKRIAQRVDLVVYTAETLRQHVENLGARKIMKLPNGVDFDHFQGDWPIPMEYESIPHPIAIYVGAMEAWFDFDLVSEAARSLPDVSFVLIGPDHLACQRLQPQPNLHLLGSRPFDSLPSYLRHADVGLIPFDVKGHAELVNSIHPLKLYEYLACGLPVVATEWEELQTLDSPARLVDSRRAFINTITCTINTASDPSGRITYARFQDWTARIGQLMETLNMEI